MKQAGDAHWWLVLGPLLLGQTAMFALWAGGGWLLAGWGGAGVGALAWWGIGTGLDWLGYRVSYRVTRGRWEFQPLGGALAGWTLPVIVLGGLALIGGLCWGLATVLGSVL